MTGCSLFIPGGGKPSAGDLTILPIDHIAQEKRNLCGPTVVAMVLNYWETEQRQLTPQQVLERVTFDPATGITLGDIKAYCAANDYHAFTFDGTLEELIAHVQRGRPVIYAKRPLGGVSHLEVVIGFNRERRFLVLDDPLKQPYKISFKKFARRQKQAENLFLLIIPKSMSQGA